MTSPNFHDAWLPQSWKREVTKPKRHYTRWPPILERAAEIVHSYDTGVTLRQLFYRLVSEELIRNVQSAYSRLSSLTARGRREGSFPDLIDRTRRIERYGSFTSPRAAIERARTEYRRDRTEGQEWSIYLGVEKAGMIEQLDVWFGEPLGLPIVPLGGYLSQTLAKQVTLDVRAQRRPAFILYAGDLDPSGEDINRDFLARTACFDEVRRVAVTPDQVASFGLQPLPYLKNQVEVDALDPNDLRRLFQDAIDQFWNQDTYTSVLERERRERRMLDEFVEKLV